MILLEELGSYHKDVKSIAVFYSGVKFFIHPKSYGFRDNR